MQYNEAVPKAFTSLSKYAKLAQYFTDPMCSVPFGALLCPKQALNRQESFAISDQKSIQACVKSGSTMVNLDCVSAELPNLHKYRFKTL